MREALYFKSEADASKDGQIRPHIRWPYPGIWKFGPTSAGPDMISGATLVQTTSQHLVAVDCRSDMWNIGQELDSVLFKRCV